MRFKPQLRRLTSKLHGILLGGELDPLPVHELGRQPYIVFGGHRLVEHLCEPHFALVGATGSGKTRNVRMLMKTALFTEEGDLRRHAIIYDAKKEWFPILQGMLRESNPLPIHILNPFDRRRVVWDMARDITARTDTRQLAAYLIPSSERLSQPYFTDSARLILSAIINTFAKRAPGRWTLRDLIEACSTKKNLDTVLAAESFGRAAHDRFVMAKSGPDVEATLLSRIGQFSEVAACMDGEQEGRRISLTDWLSGPPSILLIASDERADAALSPLNRVLFRRLFELLVSREEQHPLTGKQVWIFIDEARLAGRLDGIDHVLLKGRSKGARVVLTCQEVQGLHHVYGKERAEELLAQCTNRAALRTSNAATKQWFIDSIGKREKWITSHSTTYGGYGSRSESTQRRISDPILGSDFADLSRPSKEGGISGYFDVPGVGWYRATVPPDVVNAYQGREPKDNKEGFLPWESDERQVLKPWRPRDISRLNLQGIEPLERGRRPRPTHLVWEDLLP